MRLASQHDAAEHAADARHRDPRRTLVAWKVGKALVVLQDGNRPLRLCVEPQHGRLGSRTPDDAQLAARELVELQFERFALLSLFAELRLVVLTKIGNAFGDRVYRRLRLFD